MDQYLALFYPLETRFTKSPVLLSSFCVSNTCLMVDSMLSFNMWFKYFRRLPIITNFTGITPNSKYMNTLHGFPEFVSTCLCYIVIGVSKELISSFVTFLHVSELFNKGPISIASLITCYKFVHIFHSFICSVLYF